jgi:hypothetical protein
VINQYVKEAKLKFKIVMGGIVEQTTVGKAYGVRGYPMNYLVDAETGKIVWRASILIGDALRDALANFGLK